MDGDMTGEAARGGCLVRRPRLGLLMVRGGTCEVGEMVEGCPMDVTTDSSRLWKVVAELATEAMRCRPVTKELGGDFSLVLFSSSVRPRGLMLAACSRPFRCAYSASAVFARATKFLGLPERDDWLLWERGDWGGDEAYAEMSSEVPSGVTLRMVARLPCSQCVFLVASAALVSLRWRRCWSMEMAAMSPIATCAGFAVSLTGVEGHGDSVCVRARQQVVLGREGPTPNRNAPVD